MNGIVRVRAWGRPFNWKNPTHTLPAAEFAGLGVFINAHCVLTCSDLVQHASVVWVSQGTTNCRAKIQLFMPDAKLALLQVTRPATHHWKMVGWATLPNNTVIHAMNNELQFVPGVLVRWGVMAQHNTPTAVCGSPLCVNSQVVGICLDNIHAIPTEVAWTHLTTKTTRINSLGFSAVLHGNEGVLVKNVWTDMELEPGDVVLALGGHVINPTGYLVVPWSVHPVHWQDVVKLAVGGCTLTVWRNNTAFQLAVFPQPASMIHQLQYPPHDSIPFVVVVGLVLMPLCRNHLSFAELAPLFLVSQEPRVVVVHKYTNAPFQIQVGDVVAHINNTPVATVQQAIAALTNNVDLLELLTSHGSMVRMSGVEVLRVERRAIIDELYTPLRQLLTQLANPRTTKIKI